MPLGDIADKSFEHRGRFGSVMRASHCDLRNGWVLEHPASNTAAQNATDVAEIFCWFWANIVPELNGFNLSQCRTVTKS